MKRISILLIIVSNLLYRCCPEKKSVKAFEDKVNFFSTYVMKINDSVMRDTFNMYITHRNRYIIYELPYHVTSAIDNILLYDSLKLEYFIFDSTKNYGYRLKNTLDSPGLHVNKDSFLKNRAMMDMEMYKATKVYKITNDTEIISGHNVLHKYYIADTLTDSAYYYYNSAKKDKRFSLSKILDSAYNSKLYKVILFYKKNIFSDSEKKIFDGVELEIKKVPLTNSRDMEILIDKIEKAERQNN